MIACVAETGPTLSESDALAKSLAMDMTRKISVEAILHAVDGNKDAPIAIICRTRNRTTYTQEAVHEIGFTRVYNVKEGMAGSGAGPGWVRRGLPLGRCRT
jgi:rhodanese-related sulfurtransferase